MTRRGRTRLIAEKYFVGMEFQRRIFFTKSILQSKDIAEVKQTVDVCFSLCISLSLSLSVFACNGAIPSQDMGMALPRNQKYHPLHERLQ